MKKLKQYESEAITIADILNLVKDIPNWESFIIYMSCISWMDEHIENDFKLDKDITFDDLDEIKLNMSSYSVRANELCIKEEPTKLIELTTIPSNFTIKYDYEDGFIFRNCTRVIAYEGFIYLD